MQLICGSWYGGEMKKGMFSMMNYLLPQKGIASMHCSANEGKDGLSPCSSVFRDRQDNAWLLQQGADR